MSEKTMRVQDYPLATRCPEHILTPTGKPLTDITLEKVLSGEVGPQDVRVPYFPTAYLHAQEAARFALEP